MVWVLGLLFAGLLAVHMARPRFLRRRLSSARFFKDLPPPRLAQSRLRLGKPRFTRPFLLQLLVLSLLLAAVLFMEGSFIRGETRSLGVWVLVDTSASMSTLQDGLTRMELARQEVGRALERISGQDGAVAPCLHLSTFDLERRDFMRAAGGPALRMAVDDRAPRALGTDANLVFGLLGLAQNDPDCRITHLLVLSDLPAPDWVFEERDIRIIWRDVGARVENQGITAIRASRNPLTGTIRHVDVTVTAYGPPPRDTRLVVNGPKGNPVPDRIADWRGRTWTCGFAVPEPGLYQLRLLPGGAYTYDDTAVIEIAPGKKISVDWQLGDKRLLRQLGWTQSEDTPRIRVAAGPGEDRVPTLIVGNAYRQADNGTPVPIYDFIEGSPLLEDLNLDALESLGLPQLSPPPNYEPVLRGREGNAWVAQRLDPPSVFVPGLPTGADDLTGRVSATLFFNALRWLLREREPDPVFSLTTPDRPEPGGTRLALHEDEGNTYRYNHSAGDMDDLEPVAGEATRVPIWPLLLAAAVLVFVLERGMAAFGGVKWR